MAGITYETSEQYFTKEEWAKIKEQWAEHTKAVNELIESYRKTNNDYTTDREEIIEFLGL